MGRFYRGLSVLSGIFVWSMVFLRTTDGRNITWYKPPPSETVTDARVVSETNKNLTKGSLNEELSCEFSLTADLSIFTVAMDFDGYNLATYAGSTVVLDPRFVGRGNATWIPTKLTLTVFNVTTADAGIYECKVLTAAGTWTRKFPLTVLDQSSITFISENQTVNDGDLLWLNCTAMGTPQPIPAWTSLSDNRTVDMPFTITGKQDEGGYMCTADNTVGNAATSVVFVTVESYRPFNTYLSTNLTNATAELNETIYLTCSAEANPEAKYRLYKGDASIENITATSHNIGVYATSVSDRVKEVVYKCIPFNSFGDGPAKKLIVTLHYPVEATGNGTNPRVAEGAVISFSCPVNGNPEPNIAWYKGRETSAKPMSVEKVLTVEALRESVCYTCVADNSLGDPISISQCLIVDPNLTTVSSTTVSGQSTTSAPPLTKQPNTRKQPNTTSAKPDPDDTLWIIIGCATGGVVVLAICVLTWWVHNKRKCRNDAKIHNSDLERHDGAYAQSGPPAANGTDDAADQQIEVEAAIPTYAAVDKSKKSKKQADERPPEYAVVDKSKKTEKPEAAAIPTYAAVDKSKKKKKSHEEVPAVYAEVDKSKKKKKKKIDDKNLYENLDEPKKEKKPGELLYADLGDFQNPNMPTVSTSPQPLPAIKKADPYERTDYADITQFLKGNATLPPNDGNGDTEMKPKRPSKKKEIQGKDKETPI